VTTPAGTPAADPELIGAATDRPAYFDDRALFGHPRGLALLFVVEMWERFSYYGMRSLLVLYMVHALGWPDDRADHLYGLYTGAVYLTPLLGGFLADRLLGTRRSLVIGAVIIACGHFVLAVPGMPFFYLGLTLVVIGTGFFKPNVSTMVGQLYRPGDRRRDGGFTIFYMGINVGGILAPLVCGYLGQRVGWHYGFAAAGVGMLLGLAAYITLRDKYLPGIGFTPTRPAPTDVSRPSLPAAHGRLSPDERKRVIAIGIVFVLASFFWVGYEQAGSSLTLFADRYTDLHLGHWSIPSSWFQSAQPGFVIIFAPVFAYLWRVLGAEDREPSTALKMAMSLALISIAYGIMIFGGRIADHCVDTTHAVSACAVVNPGWLTTTYLFTVLGELCISPVGLSYVTKVAPARVGAFLMGCFFLSNSAGNYFAGRLAGLTASIPTQGQFFAILLYLSLAAAVVAFVCVPLLKRLTVSVTDS
jgi:POT family proton-dependent oligopeptide transporter